MAPDSHTPGQRPDFTFYTQAQVFENLSKSAEKRHMRIGGPIGSECEDLAKEVVLQEGLNYDDFLGVRGFFNKNHSADTLDILGAPEQVKLFAAGQAMPNGQIAKHATTWVEGFLYDTAKGRETYELAKAMQGSGKSLGFSIEGHVEQRSGPGNRTIAKARIQNVAITHVPCNPDARLEVLLRSVQAMNGEAFDKALTVGGGALAVAQEGFAVPMIDAKTPEATPPTGLQLTREELDARIVALINPLLAELIQSHIPGEIGKSLAAQRRDDAQAARTDALLRKAAHAAAAHAAGMAQALSVPPQPAVRARKSLSSGQLLQSIYRAMPGVSVAYAQELARNIQRESPRS